MGIANGHKGSFWSNENILKLDCGDCCITVNLQKVTAMYLLNV